MNHIVIALTQMRKLLAKGFCHKAWAEDDLGRPLSSSHAGDPRAVCWCLVGAIHALRLPTPLHSQVYDHLEDLIPNRETLNLEGICSPLVAYSDSCTQGEILEFMDRAIHNAPK